MPLLRVESLGRWIAALWFVWREVATSSTVKGIEVRAFSWPVALAIARVGNVLPRVGPGAGNALLHVGLVELLVSRVIEDRKGLLAHYIYMCWNLRLLKVVGLFFRPSFW